MQQVLEVGVRRRRGRPRPQLGVLMGQIAQDQGRITGVGLGAHADAVAVTTEPVAVDHIDRVPQGLSLLDQGLVVVSGRFHRQRHATRQAP